MIIGHMPAGFLVTYGLLRKYREQPAYLMMLFAGLFASIAPDLDLFYHHFIDERQHGHHSYWTHIPVYWVSIYLVLLFPVKKFCSQQIKMLLHVMFFAVMSHMLLDSITSGIKWLYPFDNHYHGLWQLWRIPDRYDWWVINYLLHWTFIYELTLLASCLLIVWRDRSLRTNVWLLIRKYCCPVLRGYFIDKRKTPGVRDPDNQL